jgi:hypothetical protein
VLRETSEAGLQKIKRAETRVLPYTARQVERELRRLSRLEDEIQNSRAFLEKLRQ